VIDLGSVVVYGAVLSVLTSLIFLSSVLFNPRFARNDLPQDIRERVPPLTKREKLHAVAFLLPAMALTIGIPLALALSLRREYGSAISFLSLTGHILAVLLMANVFELLVVDWLVFCTLTPKRLVIPGTEGMAGYRDYLHQLKSHVRGALAMVLLSLVLAGVVLLAT
jgi:hypothetical protein